MKTSLVWLGLGGLAWSASEYAIHRFVGHGPKRTKPGRLGLLTPGGFAYEFNREHLAHHADTTYFAPTWRKAIAGTTAIAALTALGTPLLGPRRARAFALGFGGVYLAYEVMHRITHTRAPRTRYGRWVRRHHLLHHHKTPRQNHGVTSPIWDHLFGTDLPHEKVRIPRHVAPAWLVDARGEVKAEYASEYELVGGGRRGSAVTPGTATPQASTTSNVPSMP